MPMEFGYPPHESCNIPSRTKIHSEKRFVFLGKPPFHPCLYMNGRAFEMVFLFAAHQIFRLAVISDTGNEWIALISSSVYFPMRSPPSKSHSMDK